MWVPFALYADISRPGRLTRFLISGGQNVLLAYLLAPVFHFGLAVADVGFYDRIGHASVIAGVARSTVFAALVLGLAGWLKDHGVRLKL
jgi:hypothetical protein